MGRKEEKQPTTTKWVDRWKADDQGGRFVRCRLVGRDFKVKGVEEREDFLRQCRGRRAAEEKGTRGGKVDVC